jgi:antitoxin (DNA-binding transcriptional repressor) of toxin-antitoxin stability system
MFILEEGGFPMKLVTFTQFRQNAAAYFNAVEKGEVVQILRHGKAIAEITPITVNDDMISWKQPGLRLLIRGASLSREILKERKASKR